MKKLILGLALASIGTSATARPLWMGIESGMSYEEVQALYPKSKNPPAPFTRIDHYHRTTDMSFKLMDGCWGNAKVDYKKGIVREVVVQQLNGGDEVCSQTVLQNLTSKYGKPHAESDYTQTSYNQIGIRREGYTFVHHTWIVDGVEVKLTVRQGWDWKVEYRERQDTDGTVQF